MAQGLYQIYKNRAQGQGFYKSDITQVPRVIAVIYPTLQHRHGHAQLPSTLCCR